MLTDKNDDINVKHKISRIYHMANKLYKDEFKDIFVKSRIEFRDWINQKTKLNEDHIKNRDKAIDNWLIALEWLYKRVNRR